jgi:tetratricopeptide (TPR) repeat protein/CHAT domain-containing protein
MLIAPSSSHGAGAGRLEELKALNRDGKFAAAAEGARTLFAETSAARSTDSLHLATILDVLVESLWRGGKAREPEAHAMALRALEIRERRFGSDHLEVAAALTALGNVHFARNDFDGARPHLERALGIRERNLAPDDLAIAATLSPLGNVFRRKADYAAARPLLERALAIREKRLGPDHADVASSLSNLGTLYGDLGDYAGARAAYERVVKIRQKTTGPDHPDLASAYDNLGLVLRVTGDYAAARAAHEQGLAIRERSLKPDDPAIASSLQNLGLVMRSLGFTAEARVLYERAAAIREKAFGPEDPEFARAITNLANLLREMSDYGAARPLYERALAIREKALGPDHPDVANTLYNFGLLLENAGDYAAARRRFERALEIREQKLGPEHAGVAIALWSLAGVVERQGDYPGARALYERSLGVWEKAVGPQHVDVALPLNGLAGTLVAMGDFSAARAACERGLAIRESAYGSEHQKVAESLEQLAEIFTATGDVPAARPRLERALAIRDKVHGRENPEAARTLYQLARVRAMQGERSEALDQALEAERIARAHQRTTARGLSEREALRYAAVRPLSLDLSLSLVADKAGGPARRRVLDALVRSRAIVLDEMAARHRAIQAASDSSVARRAAELASARERLAGLMVRGASGAPADGQGSAIDDARARMESAERRLAEVNERFAQDLSRSRIGLDEVAASLPDGSALVAVTRYRDLQLSRARPDAGRSAPAESSDPLSYLAFVLRAGERDPLVVSLGPASSIDRKVARWGADAGGAALQAGPPAKAERAIRESGAALRESVWDPLAVALAGASRVFVVPDGSLNLVNLAALPARGQGYLIEHGPLLHVVSAERDLVPAEGAHPGRGLLAIGAVDYDAPPGYAPPPSPEPALVAAHAGGPPSSRVSTGVFRGSRSECRELAATRFEPLPATGTESGEIVRIWQSASGARGEASYLTSQAANESAFKQSAPGRRVLHLATHGFFLGDCRSARTSTRGLGALSETPARKNAPPLPAPAQTTPAMAGENPLRLSGLVFAGANRRGTIVEGEEDGILTAEEIASLDLSGTEWVVLSACETGIGDVQAGEGVLGLRRGFQIAGAGALIMSLWSVDDESARAWMQALYQARLERGLHTDEAVREAGLAVLKQRGAAGQSTHPFYWAAFIGAGNWR